MTTVGVAEYDVLLSRSKLQAEVSAASRTIETGMAGSARKVESEFGSAAKTALKGFVAFEGFKFGREAISGAVSLAQQQQRANVEFGKGVQIVDDYAAHAAKGAGLSERAALSAASAFGTLFHGLGVADRESATMSTTLVQLSADFAALHGTSQEQAVQAIQRGLGGMGRGLRQYGIFLTDANLKQEAVNLGLYKGSGALSQAAKTQAAYALIVKGGVSANGAFADSADTLLGRQKILDAEWDNTKDKIGNDLVPAMLRLVHVGTDVLDFFDRQSSGVQQATLVAVAGAVAYKTFGGAIGGIYNLGKSAIEALAGMATASTEDAVATEADTAAKAEASSAILAEQASADALVVALQAVGASEAEVAVATGAAAAGTRALSGAQAQAALTGKGLTASLGPIAIAAAGLITAYQSLTHLTAHHSGLPDDTVSKVLAANRGELVKYATTISQLYGGKKGFEALGATPEGLVALKAMAAATGTNTVAGHQMAGALRDISTGASAAADKERRFGAAVFDSTAATDKAKASADDLAKIRQAEVDGAIAAVDKEHDIQAAIFAEQDSSAALTQAIKDQATARRAATGDSDEYRAALAAIARDKDAEAKASRDVTQAERDLADAREQARRSLRDEILDNESAIISAERAKLALEDSKDALAKTQDDPRATGRQKEQALLDERDAEIALQQAQNKRGDSATDLARAEAEGVNGAPSVVAAKQQVADAIKAQGDAEKQTATDTKAAAKVISDAKDTERQATVKLRDAVMAEATAQENIAKLAYGAAAGHDAFNASLLRSVAMLDPNSPLVKELNAYADQLAYLATIETVTIGTFPGGPQGHSTGQGEIAGRPQRTPHAPGQPGLVAGSSRPGGSDRAGKIINIGTVNTHQGATAIEVANELAFGTH